MPWDTKDLLANLDPASLADRVKNMLDAHVRDAAQHALKKWKEKVKEWKPTSKEASYLRNSPPSPSLALKVGDAHVYGPYSVQESLISTWSRFENWSDPDHLTQALDAVEQWYSFLIPRVQMWAWPDANTLKATASEMKKSAVGPDGWAIEELMLLPVDAWEQLSSIIKGSRFALSGSLTSWFRRVAIPKKQGLIGPDQVRPIDIHSTIVRIISSAVCRLINPGTKAIVHRNQYATMGGTRAAGSQDRLPNGAGAGKKDGHMGYIP